MQQRNVYHRVLDVRGEVGEGARTIGALQMKINLQAVQKVKRIQVKRVKGRGKE